MISEIGYCFRFRLSVKSLAITDRSENCVLMTFRTLEKRVFPLWAAVVFFRRSLNLGPVPETATGSRNRPGPQTGPWPQKPALGLGKKRKKSEKIL